MKGRQIVLDEMSGRQCAALLVDGRLDDLLVGPAPDDPPFPGAIFRARAERALKGQGGMILSLPGGANAFFRGAKGLKQGQCYLVQVLTHAEPGKAATVTDRLIFKGRAAIVTTSAKGLNISRSIQDEEERLRLRAAADTELYETSDYGLIIRSEALHIASDDISVEVDALLTLAAQVLSDEGDKPELLVDAPDAHELAIRDWPKAPVETGFEARGVLDALAELEGPEAALNPGSLVIEPTRALVAVDVNTGADTSPAAGLKVNLAAARDLPRQLRLRGLGGQIVIDLAPMPKKDRRQFEQVLRSAFRADPIETALVGWTPLGHFELSRKRERLPWPKGVFG